MCCYQHFLNPCFITSQIWNRCHFFFKHATTCVSTAQENGRHERIRTKREKKEVRKRVFHSQLKVSCLFDDSRRVGIIDTVVKCFLSPVLRPLLLISKLVASVVSGVSAWMGIRWLCECAAAQSRFFCVPLV